MNTKEIEVLLEKFYEGNTSLREEKLLRDFFRGHKVPAHLESHKQLFVFFADEQQQEINDENFDVTLTRHFSEKPVEKQVVPIIPKRNRFLFITGIAATILLLISFLYTFQHDVFKTEKSRNNNYNTELAYTEASEALLLVSLNLNTGLKEVSRLQMVDKAMKNMQLFNKFYQYQPIFINPDEFQNQSKKAK